MFVLTDISGCISCYIPAWGVGGWGLWGIGGENIGVKTVTILSQLRYVMGLLGALTGLIYGVVGGREMAL